MLQVFYKTNASKCCVCHPTMYDHSAMILPWNNLKGRQIPDYRYGIGSEFVVLRRRILDEKPEVDDEVYPSPSGSTSFVTGLWNKIASSYLSKQPATYVSNKENVLNRQTWRGIVIKTNKWCVDIGGHIMFGSMIDRGFRL